MMRITYIINYYYVPEYVCMKYNNNKYYYKYTLYE